MYYAGLDIGGTKTAGVLLNEEGDQVATSTLPARRGNEGVIGQALAVISTLLAEAGVHAHQLRTVGVGIPGVVDPSSGVVHNAVNLSLTELRLQDELEAALKCPVRVDNDVNVAALGAAADLGLRGSVAYLNVGTGLAASLVVDGKTFAGATGIAGEIGHLPVNPKGVVCGCGQVGCLETVASGSAITRQWPSSMAHPSDALLAAHLEGDGAATAVFESFVEGIAQAVRVLVLTYDPDHVVIGGGMRKLGAPLFEALDRVFARWSAESAFIASANLASRVVILPKDSNAGATGAALLGWRALA